jgi:hypothetical protein
MRLMMNSATKENGLITLYYGVLTLTIFIFTIFCVFAPADVLNLKKGFFAITVILGGPLLVVNSVNYKNDRLLLFIAIGYPVIFILASVLLFNNSLSNAITIGHCGIYFLLYFLIVDGKIPYQKTFIFALSLEAIFIFFCGVLHYAGIMPVSVNPLLQYLYQSGDAMVGFGSYATSFGLMIFIKTSPLLIVLLGYTLQQKRYFLCVVCFLALLFSGTRANTFTGIILIFIYVLAAKANTDKWKIIKMFIIFGIIIFVLFYGRQVILALSDLRTRRAANDAVRVSYIQDILNLYKTNPLSIIVGTGFGSGLYSSTYSSDVNIIESAYIDLLRQVGLIGFIPFMSFIFYPIKSVFKEVPWIAISYIGYLVIAATNPLLYSSTAFILYVFIYSIRKNGYSFEVRI